MRRRLPPAVVLFIVAPVFGEVFSGSTRITEFINPVTFITEALLYGCGAILVRELVIRWRKGWPSMLLLGFAYGIYEEGLVVQSFFDPGWHDLGALAVYGRLWGVNWVWAEHLTIYHAVISILASVVFVQAFYPDRRTESWVVSRRWLFANCIGLLSVYALWSAFNKYDAGLWKPASALAIIALAVAARLAPTRVFPPKPGRVPRPWRFWVAGFLGMFGQFFLVYAGTGSTRPFQAEMAAVLVYDLLILGLVLWWSGAAGAWDDRHRVALLGGALSFFLVMGPLTAGGRYPVLYFSNPIFLFLLWLAAWHVGRRYAATAALSPAA
jgi:hypothetical protein